MSKKSLFQRKAAVYNLAMKWYRMNLKRKTIPGSGRWRHAQMDEKNLHQACEAVIKTAERWRS